MSGNEEEEGSDEAREIPFNVSGLFGTKRALARQLEQMKTPRSVTRPFGGLAQFRSQLQSFDFATSGLKDIARSHRELTESLGKYEFLTSVASVQSELQQWTTFSERVRKMMERQSAAADIHPLPWQILGRDLERVGQITKRLSASYPNLSERLLAPHLYYSRFSRGVLDQLKELSSGPEARALSGSLLLAEDQITATTGLYDSILEEPVGPDVVARPPDYNLFERARDELLESDEVPSADEPGALYDESPSMQEALVAREVANRVGNCNRNAEMQGDGEVFRTSTAMVESVADLGYCVARDKNTLGEVVDALYTILYEGAGSDNLRYLNRGYVTDTDCEPVWMIKQLRNYWFRHDPERGSSSEQKMKKLRKALARYGLDGMPSSPDEFQMLHRKLLRDARDFLAQLEEEI